MARHLIVTWDGAGNLVPTLGIARNLIEAGHDVRILGHDTIRERCGDVGARFISLSQAEGWDQLDNPDDFEAEVQLMMDQLCFSTAIARDTGAELEREPADVVMVDCMLFTAMNFAQASGIPTATLFHTAYTIFRGGPLVEMFSPGLEALNAHRVELGLDPVAALGDVHDACDLALVALPMEFEPDAGDAPNVVRMGPVLDAPPLVRSADDVDITGGSTPMVLVSLSTSEQGQAELLQRLVDAVAALPVRAIVTTGPSIDPATVTAGVNTQVVSYVPHAELLPWTSLVITHAGLGTVMSALGNGVPLLCTPMGRDQFFNAQQVQALGAGRMLPPDADVSAIIDAAREILDDATCQAAAKQLAITISGYGGAADAVTALERLSAVH
jgi:MGT family glycosyltransferase